MSDAFTTEHNTEITKKQYPEGSMIKLISIQDNLTKLKPGSKGIVLCVDDDNQIHVKWQSGSHLALIPGIDSFVISK